MGNFPLTRIALNLLLIVSLAIQPVAACAFTADCAVRCSGSDTVMCPGCGCCEVEGANDRCCCCSGTAKSSDTEAAKPSCCSHKESAVEDVFGEPSADLETPEPTCKLSDSKDLEAIDSEATVQSVCLCEQNSQPLSDTSPRRPVNESRVSLAIGCADQVGDECDGRLSHSVARNSTDVPTLAHFSQIVLCIWRL